MRNPRKTKTDQARYTTVNELALRQFRAPSAIWQDIYSGKIKVARFGRSVRIPLEEVERIEREALERGAA